MIEASKDDFRARWVMMLLFASFCFILINEAILARTICNFLSPAICCPFVVISGLPLLVGSICTRLFDELFIHECHRHDQLEYNTYWMCDRVYTIHSRSWFKKCQMRYTYLMLGNTHGRSIQRFTMSATVIALAIELIAIITLPLVGVQATDLLAATEYLEADPRIILIGDPGHLDMILSYLGTMWGTNTILGIIIGIGYAPTLWYWGEIRRKNL